MRNPECGAVYLDQDGFQLFFEHFLRQILPVRHVVDFRHPGETFGGIEQGVYVGDGLFRDETDDQKRSVDDI